MDGCRYLGMYVVCMYVCMNDAHELVAVEFILSACYYIHNTYIHTYIHTYSHVYHIVNDPGRDDLDRHPLIVAKHAEVCMYVGM